MNRLLDDEAVAFNSTSRLFSISISNTWRCARVFSMDQPEICLHRILTCSRNLQIAYRKNYGLLPVDKSV